MAVHAFAQASLAILGNQARLVVLRDEIVQVMVRFHDDITAASAITAAGTSLGPILLTLERDGALPP